MHEALALRDGGPFHYALGGFHLRSQLRLPSCALLAQEGAPVLDLRFGPGPADALSPRWIVEQTRPGESEPYLRVGRSGPGYLLVHRDGVEFVLSKEPAVIITRLDPTVPLAHLEHILLDQILPLVMSALGRMSLHASAVAWEEEAIAFLGTSGGGKSTTAACAVARCGASLVADDQAVLEPSPDGWWVHPSYPSVRLLEDAVGALFELSPTGERKQRVAVRPRLTPARLAAVVLLERGAETPPQLLGPKDALVGIALHVDRLDPTDRPALRAELDRLADLVQRVPTVRVAMPRDLARLAPSIQAIRQVIAAVRSGRSPDRER